VEYLSTTQGNLITRRVVIIFDDNGKPLLKTGSASELEHTKEVKATT
jgi:hypothetical protein